MKIHIHFLVHFLVHVLVGMLGVTDPLVSLLCRTKEL